MIVDASVILRAFFPDEDQDRAQTLIRDHVTGHLQLAAPDLLLYEVANAVIVAQRRGRITNDQAEHILTSFDGLEITLLPVSWGQLLPMAIRFDRSAYDAAYLALAQAEDRPLMTGDARMFNAVHEHLDWVLWIGDYDSAT